LGAVAVGKDGAQVKVNEYNPIEKGVRPVVKAAISGNSNKTFFSLYSSFLGDLNRQNHDLSIDINRVVKQKFTFDAMYHRLDHDPMTNLDVISEARSAVYVEDFNPTDEYHIKRNVLTSSTTLSIPSLPFLKLYTHFRNEHRSGEYQARTLSKCSACHVVAKSRPISNNNRDIQVGGMFNVGKGVFDYSFTGNQFKENEAAPTSNYLKVEHPEKISPVFTSRISVGNETTLPFDAIPNSKKNTHLFKTSIPITGSATFSAQYLNSTVDNTTSDLRWKSNSFIGAFSTTIGKRGFLNARFRHLKISNDSYFVDVAEPLDVAGPNVGMTYAQAYGLESFDFMRNSALSRTVLDFDANFRYRLTKALRLRLGFQYKAIDREHYDVENTKASTLKAQLTFKPVNKLKFTLDGRYKTITDPFANMNGAIAPVQQTQAYDNPFVGTQFFMWHEARQANLTNFPRQLSEIKGRVNWSASAKFAVNGNFQYRKEENDDLNFASASWNRDVLQFGADMWFMLSDKLPVSVSYNNYTTDYSSIFSIAVLEGCGAGIVGGMSGTLTDMMDYNINNQTLLLNFNYLASENFSLFCNFNYNDSLAEINDLVLDTSQVDFIPGNVKTALNYEDFGGVADYSRLDIRQMIGELGFNASLSESWALNGSFYYYLYDDLAEYLFTDTTGKNVAVYFGLTWKK
jgi:hypothetical protein